MIEVLPLPAIRIVMKAVTRKMVETPILYSNTFFLCRLITLLKMVVMEEHSGSFYTLSVFALALILLLLTLSKLTLSYLVTISLSSVSLMLLSYFGLCFYCPKEFANLMKSSSVESFRIVCIVSERA